MTYMRKITILLASFAVAAASCAVSALACTTAIISAGASQTGRPILWKQRDNKYKNCVIYNDEGKYAFVGIANLPVANEKHLAAGVNEVGFAIVRNTCNSMLHESVDKSRTMSILYLALTQCRTVDDFEALLNSIPTPRPFGSNFGVIDGCGGAAYFEAGDLSYNRYDVPDGEYMIRTNFALKPVKPLDSFTNMSVERYEQATYHMERHKGKFSSEWMMKELGRSFYSSCQGTDLLRHSLGGTAFDRDCICRKGSISQVSIEGVMPGDAPNSSVMWTIGGYPACSYAMPVWVAAGNEMPACLKDAGGLTCDVFETSSVLRARVHPKYFEYIDFKILKPILKEAFKAEAVEFAEGRKVDAILRKGFDAAAVREYNAKAQERWELWKKKML